MNVALWIAQVLLAVVFLMAGFMKAFLFERAKASLPWVQGTARGLVLFIGLAELLGGLGLVLPPLFGWPAMLTPLAALGLAVIMVLAAGFHIKRGEGNALPINLILLLLAAFIAYGRWPA